MKLKNVAVVVAALVLAVGRLVGKRFMYVFDGRYIEVIYKAENFRHLTGVETFLSGLFFCSRFESLIYWATKILGLEEYGSNT